MTQTEERPKVPEPTPLTNPVPGAWLQLQDTDILPVYVPFEPQYRKNEATGKDIVVGHAPGAHIKRLLSEGAMYTSAPGGAPVEQQTPELAATEAQLRSELEQSRAMQEAMQAELQELRLKMATDHSMPNAARKR